MSNIPNEATKIEVDGSTVDFFELANEHPTNCRSSFVPANLCRS